MSESWPERVIAPLKSVVVGRKSGTESGEVKRTLEFLIPGGSGLNSRFAASQKIFDAFDEAVFRRLRDENEHASITLEVKDGYFTSLRVISPHSQKVLYEL